MRIFTGNFEINGVQSVDTYEIRANSNRARTAVRSTFTEDAYESPGDLTRALTISYFTGSLDGASTAISTTAQIIDEYVESGEEFEVSGTFFRGPVTAGNPRYTWRVYAMESQIGGVEGESTTYTTALSVIDAPVIETS